MTTGEKKHPRGAHCGHRVTFVTAVPRAGGQQSLPGAGGGPEFGRGGLQYRSASGGNRIGLIEGLVTLGPPPPHLLLGEGSRVLFCSSSLPLQGAFVKEGDIFVVMVFGLRSPLLPAWS